MTTETRAASSEALTNPTYKSILIVFDPSFIPDTGRPDGPVSSTYGQARQSVEDHIVKTYAPIDVSHLVVLLPMPDTSAWEQRDETGKPYPLKADATSWATMARRLRERAISPQNVLVMPKLLPKNNPEDPEPATVMLDALENRGYAIGEDTRIIVAGEWVNASVTTGSKRLFRDEKERIKQIQLDLSGVLGKTHKYTNLPHDDPEHGKTLDTFINTFANGYEEDKLKKTFDVQDLEEDGNKFILVIKGQVAPVEKEKQKGR